MKQSNLVAELVAYGKRPNNKCWTCSLPPDLLKSIHDARKEGARITGMVSYLVDKMGYKREDAAKLRHHFGNRHHER